MTNDSLNDRLEKQYATQKALNPSGSDNLVRDFFAAVEYIRQHQADLVARLEQARRNDSASTYLAYQKAIEIVRGGE